MESRTHVIDLRGDGRQRLKIEGRNERTYHIGELIQHISIRCLLHPFACLPIDELYTASVFQILECALDAVAIIWFTKIKLPFTLSAVRGLFLNLFS